MRILLLSILIFSSQLVWASQCSDGLGEFSRREFVEGILEQTKEFAEDFMLATLFQDSSYLQSLRELEASELLEVAAVAIRNEGEGAFIDNLFYFEKLSSNDYISLNKMLIREGYGTLVLMHFRELTSFIDRADKIKLLEDVIKAQNGLDFVKSLRQFKFLTPEEVRKLVKLAIIHHDNVIYFTSQAEQIDKLSDNTARSLIQFAQYLHPIRYIEDTKYFSPEYSNYETLKDVLKMNLDISHKEIDMAWDLIKDIDAGLDLLKVSAIKEANLTDYKTSESFLLDMIGVGDNVTLSELSYAKKKQFYEIALDILKKSDSKLFENNKFDKDIFSKKNANEFIDFLETIRNLQAIDESFETYFQKEYKNKIFTVENIKSEKEKLRVMLEKWLKKALESVDSNISYEDLMKMKDRWESLAPIYTLISRYKGYRDWNGELIHLGEILEAASKNNFKNFKFSTPQAREQIDFIDDKKLQVWMKNRVRISRAQSSVADSGEKERGFTHLLENLLVVHVADVFSKLDLKIKNQKLIDSVQNFKGNPQNLYKDIADDLSEEEVIASLINALKNKDTDRKKVLSFLNSNSQALGLTNQIRNDLKALSDVLKDSKKASKNDLVATLSSHDEKFLLTIGDAVNTSSCQNYKTGSHIDTLPGYVMDANVQAMVSHVINEASFDKTADFNQLLKVIDSDLLKVKFDGNKNIIHFSHPDISTINTRPLGYAYRRHMIKVGKTSAGKAKAFIEPAYSQNHELQPIMQRQSLEIINEINEKLDAPKGELELTVSESRNSGGVYSDLSGGVMLDEYQVKLSN